MPRVSERIGQHERRRFGGILQEPRVLLGVAVMCIATVIGAVTMQRATARVQVWQFDRALAADTVIAVGDVHVAAVAGEAFRSAYAVVGVPVAGKRLAHSVTAGEYVTTSVLAAPDSKVRSVTVPVAPLHSPIGLAHGARVDVWVTVGADDARAKGASPKTRLVLAGVLVDAVTTSEVSGGLGVVLRVAPDDEGKLVAALRAGDIDLVRIGDRT